MDSQHNIVSQHTLNRARADDEARLARNAARRVRSMARGERAAASLENSVIRIGGLVAFAMIAIASLYALYA